MRHLLLPLIAAVAPALVSVGAPLPPYAPAPTPRERVAVRPVASLELPALPGGVAVRPSSYTERVSLNGTWRISKAERSGKPFAAEELRPEASRVDFDDASWEDIRVPFDLGRQVRGLRDDRSRPYVRVWYRRTFRLTPEQVSGRRVTLHFERIGYEADVFVNGRRLPVRHSGDFTPFSADVTELVQAGENAVSLRVLSDMGPAFGLPTGARHVYGSQWSTGNIRMGLWGDVTLVSEPCVGIGRLLVTPDIGRKSAEVDVSLSPLPAYAGRRLRLAAAITPATASLGAAVCATVATAAATPDKLPTRLTLACGGDIRLWDVESPNLYYCTLFVLDEEGRVLNARTERFGFREFRTENGHFLLNGRRIYLFGENFASMNVGGMGRTPEEEDTYITEYIATMRSYGYVMLRNAHQPILPKTLAIADELGMMFFNEWGFCFTNKLDEPAFERNNLAEVRRFVEETYNYASVTMWSMGNEVSHSMKPDVVRQLDRQAALVRELDRQRRPISTFSGAAGWTVYGRNPLLTDVHDLHNYTALSDNWTGLHGMFDYIIKGIGEIYGEKLPLSRPLVDWENVGFSWGWRHDATFRQDNIEDYLKYANGSTTWGQPNGIGFSGCLPLHLALSPSHNHHLPQNIYGRRIFELFRLYPGWSGFAPWFSNAKLDVATLWNQPVLPTLHNRRFFPPRNLFAGEPHATLLEISNCGDGDFADVTLQVTLASQSDGSVTPVAIQASPVAVRPHRNSTAVEATLAIPSSVRPGYYQLRLDAMAGGVRIGQNYYDVFVQARPAVTAPIRAVRPVFVLDTGVAANVRALTERLTALQVAHTVTASPDGLPADALLIVPPELEPQLLMRALAQRLESFVHGGGFLLVLEQFSPGTELPCNLVISAYALTFADPIRTSHPIFRNLDWRNFDSWEDGGLRYVTLASYKPISVNALAARGIKLGQKAKDNIGMAALEGTYGRGRLLASQFNAFRACQQDDASALTYLRNLLDYACAQEQPFHDIRPLAIRERDNYVVAERRAVRIDLSRHTNRSFSDDVDGDRKGGWTDQGDNDFSNMPLGQQTLAGVPFTILDPAKNGGTSCIVLAGTQRSYFPLAAKEIPLKGRFSRVFLLHTAAWGGAQNVGAYRFRYADGTTVTLPLVGNQNIGDWWYSSAMPNARTGLILPHKVSGSYVCAYVTEWLNPHPLKELVSFDFLSPLYREREDIDFLPTATGVPVLIAATAERAHEQPFEIVPGRVTSWSGIATPPKTTSAVSTVIDDGTGKGKLWQCVIPDTPAGDEPVAFFSHRRDNDQLADRYDYLTLRIRANSPARLRVTIPSMDWKSNATATLVLIGDNQFHTYRFRFGQELKAPGSFALKNWRGELFFYFVNDGRPRKGVTFAVQSAVLE